VRGARSTRRSARARKRRRPGRGVLRAAALVCLGSALGGALYGASALTEWALTSETFAVKRVSVLGDGWPGEYAVMETAGAVRGLNLFKVPVEEVERSLSALPGIKCCRVEKRLPDRLVVRVAPRRPFFLFSCSGLWRVDREGVVLGRAQSGDLDSLAVASWQRGRCEDLETGMSLEEEPVGRVRSLIAAMRRYAPDLDDQTSEICVDEEGEVTFFTKNPPHRVLLGRGAPKTENLVALTAVLGDLRRRGLSGMEIDMRFDRQIVVRSCGRGAAMRNNS